MPRNEIRPVRQRSYVAKDFAAFRNSLFDYARTYYADKITDFSEAGLGGMLIDLSATVADNMSFYMDHQFAELDPDTAVETTNIERMLRAAGVPIVGASPAVATVDVYCVVPAVVSGNGRVPSREALPIVEVGSVFTSDSSVSFNLVEEVDFTETDENDELVADVTVAESQSDGTVTSFLLKRQGLVVSGDTTSDTLSVGEFSPFTEIELTQANVSKIVSVVDGFGNVYHEVDDLTQDTVFVPVVNASYDSNEVADTLKPIPAPYRYTKRVDLSTRLTTLTFGGGSAESFEDDAIPDPADFAIPLTYRTSFPRSTLDPKKLLTTKTLGVIAKNTTVTISYSYGGGLDHNVEANTIRNVSTLNVRFPGNPSFFVSRIVRSSVSCSNPKKASGGDDAPTVEELKSLIPSYRNSQARIVSREDLISRVYTLPSNFGRVYRAGVRSSPFNTLTTRLYVVSRDSEGHLTTTTDTLKKNIRAYVNPYRLVSDAIDIVDASIVNLSFEFEASIESNANKQLVIQSALTKLKKFFEIKNFHIDQPIVESDIVNVIFSVAGIVSVNSTKFVTMTGINGTKTYSDVTFDVSANTKKGFLIPPPGGIFEVKYPDADIVGRSS